MYLRNEQFTKKSNLLIKLIMVKLTALNHNLPTFFNEQKHQFTN